jgi:hypothetical protein
MYLISLTYGALKHLGLASQDWQAYLIGRVWSAFFATSISWAVYRLARELRGGPRASLLAALWAAMIPLTVWEGHVAITDPMMTFWTTMTLWASVRLVRTGSWRDYIFAGVCLGLATGSKYTAAMSVVAIVAGSLASRLPLVRTIQGLVVAGVVSLACAFIVMPFSFIHLQTTLAAMAYEHHHTETGHFGFGLPANGVQYHRYVYQLIAAWPFSLGVALYASAAMGTLWALAKWDRRKIPVFAFALVFFGILGSWHFTPIRYYMPLVVIGALFAGLWHGALLDSLSPKIRTAGALIAAITFAYTLIFSAQTSDRFAHETRDVASAWLDKNLKPDGWLLLCGWSRYCALPGDIEKYVITGGRDESPVRKIPETAPYDLIEITSLHAERHFRQGDRDWINAYKRLRDPNGPFTQVAKFESQFINKKFYMKLDPMFGAYFVSPTLEFYRAKNPLLPTNAPVAMPPPRR